MVQIIAYGLETGHPAAYCLLFLILGIPLLAIILFGGELVIDRLREKKKQAVSTAYMFQMLNI